MLTLTVTPPDEYDYPVQYPRHEAALRAVATQAQNAQVGSALFGADGLTFKDILDSVNPLQQLPVIGSIYRSATGDTLSTVSRLAGGALLGGPIGLLAAAVGAGVEALTGGDIGAHVMAALDGGAPANTQVAQKAYLQANQLS